MDTKLLKSVVWESMGILSSNLLATGSNEEFDPKKQATSQSEPTIAEKREHLAGFLQSLMDTSRRRIDDTWVTQEQSDDSSADTADSDIDSNDEAVRNIDRVGRAITKNKKVAAEAFLQPTMIALWSGTTMDKPVVVNEKLVQLAGRQGKLIAKNKKVIAKILQSLAEIPKSAIDDLAGPMNPDKRLAITRCGKIMIEKKRAIARITSPTAELAWEIGLMDQPKTFLIAELEQIVNDALEEVVTEN
jgi:hypothetical protein